ncbi:hypothetical protein ANCDUO_00508 [Ancylostoma duodenale]|uniref:Uncharacterized protein n=1 Tax=Ancylostoma duodenale TaxID=51022 RepID=A0A0C2E1C0_9BILA|nr:hypothetical protein ANCDUO_00508 [Ancylostoma duodenale]
MYNSHHFSEAGSAAPGPWDEPEEPADEQLWSEFCELYPEGDEPSSDERGITAETVLRPKCSRCIIFRDNCVHYLNAISDLSPRITALEALKPENKMLKKLNADLTTQLEEGMQVEQTLKARVAAAEEETTKKHANEASVWRVKYEKTVDICERIQERRKKETANFDKMLNLAEGYKKELEATKAKVLEDRQQNILFMEASRKHIPSLFTLLKDIMANPAFKTAFPTSLQDEAARLCSPNVKKALRVHDELDEEDHMTEELERLVCAGPSSVPTVGLSQRSGSHISAEFLENSVARPESAGPTTVAPDFVLSELNDEEADNLLAAGAEAATIAPAVSRVAGRGGRGRGGGSRRGRGSKQIHTPSKFAASVDHDELARRYNEMLEAKLKRGDREASEPCSSGLKHMSIHGKKTVSIRQQQEAQMKVSIKEKVALMKKMDGALKKAAETLDDEELSLEKDLQTSDAPEVGQNDKLGNEGIAAMLMEDLQPAGDVDLAKNQHQAVTVSEPLKEGDGDRQPMDSQDHIADMVPEEAMDATASDPCGHGGIEEEAQGEPEVALRDAESQQLEKAAEQTNSVEEVVSRSEATTTAGIPGSPTKIVKPSIEDPEAEVGVLAAESAPALETAADEAANVAKVSQLEEGGDKEEVTSNVQKKPALAEPELGQPSPEQASNVTEKDNVAKVFVKPPKPHLAKDTKRALGLMRRLEVDLKEKVEPIPGLSGNSKRRTSREERLRRDTTQAASDTTTATTASPAKSESASLSSEPKDPVTSATHELNEEPHPIGTKETDAAAVNAAHGKEIATKIESKPAKSKEPPAMEPNDTDDDLVGSILAGARTNTVEPPKVPHGSQEPASAISKANSKSPVKNISSAVAQESTGTGVTVDRGRRRSQITEGALAKADGEQKLRTDVVASTESSGASSHVLRSQKNAAAPVPSAAPKSSMKSPDSSGTTDHSSAPEEKVQRRGRGRPRRLSGEKTESKQGGPEEELKSPPQKTSHIYPGTRSRASALMSPTPSRPSSQDGSSEEDVPPRRGGKHGNVESTASEPRFTRSTRSRTESFTSPTSSRRSSRLNSAESEQASSARKISSSQEAQKLEKKQHCDGKKKPTPPVDEKLEKGKRDRDGKDLASQSGQKPKKEQLKTDEGNTRSLRKRSFQNVEAFPVSPPPLSSKRLKTLSVQLNVDSSPASRTRTKLDTTSTPIEALEYGPHSRVKSRTGPVAPRKRKAEDESSQKKSAPTADNLSEDSTDDEDRLCVAEEEEEEELPPQASQTSVSQAVEHDEDEEERLVIDAEEDENGEDERGAKKNEDDGDTVAASELPREAEEEAKMPEDAENSQNDEAAESSPVLAKTRKASSQSSKVPPSSDETPQSGSRPSASSAHRRSLRTATATPKQPKDVDMSSSSTPQQPKAPSRKGRGSTADTPKRNADAEESATAQSNVGAAVRGPKRRLEEPIPENGSAVKKAATSESALQKKLHGALLSEQKIEVIRKTLGEAVDEIAKMDPEDFAATMVKCSLNLPSGDMWTIVQGNHRCSEPVDIHNKKENAFVSIARELSGNAYVWVEYVKKMVTTMAGQTPNVVSSTRYIRLLCQALSQAGNLLTNEEKKSYLRAALTRIFLDDTGIAIKATTYVLLSSSYELLDWMNDKNDPFSLLLSLAVTAAQITQEETAILNIATAYFFTGSAAVDVIKGLVGGMLGESIERIKAAMKPRAAEGERAWGEAAMVTSRLVLCVNLVFKGLGYRDNSALSREFCELLQSNIPTIRDLRDEVEKLSSVRPWMEVYLEAIQSVLVLVKTLSHYEI